MKHFHSLELNNCNPRNLYTCGWRGCDDSPLIEDGHVQVLYHNKTKPKKVKNSLTHVCIHLSTLWTPVLQ